MDDTKIMKYLYSKGGFFAFSVALLSITLFGVLGLGRPQNAMPFADVKFFYLAGAMFLNGDNPYHHNEFKLLAQSLGLAGESIGVFAYPPQSLILWAPLSLLSYFQARWVWTLVSIGLLLVSVYLCLISLKKACVADNTNITDNHIALVAAIMIGNPFVAHVVWTGQTSFIVLAALVIAFTKIREHKVVTPALLLAISSIKPQLSFFAFLWLLLEGRFRVVLISGMFLLISIIPSLYLYGTEVFLQWIQSTISYQGEVTNGLSYNTNINSLLTSFDLNLSSKMFPTIIGAVSIVYVSLKAPDNKKDDLNILSLLLVSGLLLIYGRDYDIAVLVPFVALLWRNSNGNKVALIIISIAAVLLFYPQRYAPKDLEIFEFRRTILLIVAWIYTLMSILFFSKSNIYKSNAS